jgi:transposase-like protein
MSVLSHLSQLFNADQCQVYIRTLRWKDRPLHCPRCQCPHVGLWGTYHYRPGVKRYWCHGCKRTFNDLTNTCSGPQSSGGWPTNKGTRQLTFAANMWDVGPTIVANEPTLFANSPQTSL